MATMRYENRASVCALTERGMKSLSVRERYRSGRCEAVTDNLIQCQSMIGSI
jgi:hypothetical protein